MKAVAAGLAGLVFALGLGLAGMTQPSKVIGFLDLGGAWDPSLAFVMVGAIGTHAIALRVAQRLEAPLLGGTFQVPERADIDAKLVGGAAIFGVGWGLAGYCPGPAVVSIPGGLGALLFTAAMLSGMGLHALATRSAPAAANPASSVE